jgi:hypothetical protein
MFVLVVNHVGFMILVMNHWQFFKKEQRYKKMGMLKKLKVEEPHLAGDTP